MRRHLCAEDEELEGVSGQILNLHRIHQQKTAQGQALTMDDLTELQALSQRHSELMSAPRSYVCDDCGKTAPKGTESCIVGHHATVHDPELGGPMLFTLDHEVYVDVRCPDCRTEAQVALVATRRANEAAMMAVRQAEIEAEAAETVAAPEGTV